MISFEEALRYVERIEATLNEHPSGDNRKAMFALQGAGRALSNSTSPCVAERGRRIMKVAEKQYGPKAAFGQDPWMINGWCMEMRMEISAGQRPET